ncbi:MAG: HAMP domain-containing histidine kinase, partial [Actinomycetia bacterium]|nr:HAMP domain-containing histidine kinase [Actinomycetes bacterium]
MSDTDPGQGSSRRWTDRIGVRWRSTAAAVLVVAVALILGGLALVLVLRHSLVNNVDATVVQRAKDIAAQIGSDDIDAAIPTINASAGDGTLVQVVDGTGAVLLSSPSLDGEVAITSVAPPPGQVTKQNLSISANDAESYRVVSVGVDSNVGPVMVVTAQSLSDVSSTYRTVATLLAVGSPFLLLAVGLATWFAVGRSLAAVDRMRSRVETIEATDLHQRVPVPKAEDEVARLAITMNEMLDRLESSASTQRRFIADASHELRSPLASLRASLDVASHTSQPGSWDDASLVMSDEVDRMTALVSQLLLLAKADEDALILRQMDVDLDDLVAVEARRLRSQTSLHVDVDAPPPRLLGDPDRLAEVLRNLTDNAASYARTAIQIALRTTAGTVVLSV